MLLDEAKSPLGFFQSCRLEDKTIVAKHNWRSECGEHNACRDCPARWSLKIPSLDIHAGQTTAILGHSGSGKSTLLNVLSFLDRPDSDSDNLTFRTDYKGDVREFGWSAGEWSQPDKPSKNEIDANTVRRIFFWLCVSRGPPPVEY